MSVESVLISLGFVFPARVHIHIHAGVWSQVRPMQRVEGGREKTEIPIITVPIHSIVVPCDLVLFCSLYQ
jgi:hypothetical protein